MRIGALARRTGLSRDTIRFYERQGLVASRASRATSNDYREYPEALVEQLEMVVKARAAGFSVADLKRLFAVLENLSEQPDGANQFLNRKILEVRAVIADASALLGLLEQSRAALEVAPRGGLRRSRAKESPARARR